MNFSSPSSNDSFARLYKFLGGNDITRLMSISVSTFLDLDIKIKTGSLLSIPAASNVVACTIIGAAGGGGGGGGGAYSAALLIAPKFDALGATCLGFMMSITFRPSIAGCTQTDSPSAFCSHISSSLPTHFSLNCQTLFGSLTSAMYLPVRSFALSSAIKDSLHRAPPLNTT